MDERRETMDERRETMDGGAWMLAFGQQSS